MKQTHAGLALVVLAAFSFAPSAAHADAPVEAPESAEASFRMGVVAYQQQQFADALRAFRQAYAKAPDWRLLYNVGQCEAELGQTLDAYHTFSRYLREGGAQVPEERAKSLSAELPALRAKLASVVVVATPAGSELLIDGLSVGTLPMLEEAVLAPGRHAIEVRHKGYQPGLQTTDLVVGERRTVDVSLAFSSAPQAPQPVVLPVAKPVPWALWVATGAAGALALGASGLALGNGGELRSLKSRVDPNPSDLGKYAERTRAFAIGADVLWVSTLVLAGVSLYFTLTRAKSEPSAAFARTLSPLGAQ
jgi:tetratricopeptide (TPR) repeat protein